MWKSNESQNIVTQSNEKPKEDLRTKIGELFNHITNSIKWLDENKTDGSINFNIQHWEWQIETEKWIVDIEEYNTEIIVWENSIVLISKMRQKGNSEFETNIDLFMKDWNIFRLYAITNDSSELRKLVWWNITQENILNYWKVIDIPEAEIFEWFKDINSQLILIKLKKIKAEREKVRIEAGEKAWGLEVELKFKNSVNPKNDK